jgi:hypothetical protein
MAAHADLLHPLHGALQARLVRVGLELQRVEQSGEARLGCEAVASQQPGLQARACVCVRLIVRACV